jgi:hypothetical protein
MRFISNKRFALAASCGFVVGCVFFLHNPVHVHAVPLDSSITAYYSDSSASQVVGLRWVDCTGRQHFYGPSGTSDDYEATAYHDTDVESCPGSWYGTGPYQWECYEDTGCGAY